MPSIFDNLTDESRLGPALRDSLAALRHGRRRNRLPRSRGWAEFADILDRPPRRRSADSSRWPASWSGWCCRRTPRRCSRRCRRQVQPSPYGADIHDLVKALTATRPAGQASAHPADARHSDRSRAADHLQALSDQLESGAVEMRVFTDDAAARQDLHLPRARQRLSQPSWAYVGSSNLTGAGLLHEPRAEHRRPRQRRQREARHVVQRPMERPVLADRSPPRSST